MAATAAGSDGVEACPKASGDRNATATNKRENAPSDFFIATPCAPAKRRAAVQPPGRNPFRSPTSGKAALPNPATLVGPCPACLFNRAHWSSQSIVLIAWEQRQAQSSDEYGVSTPG